MRLGTKVVTTAGVTVLSFTVMSGAAHADTATGESSLLSGLTDTVSQTTKIVDGVVGAVAKPAAPKRTTQAAARTVANEPIVDLDVETPDQLPVKARAAASLSASANSDGVTVSPAVDVCVTTAASCDDAPPPPGTPPPPSEPPTPGTPPAPPTASGNVEAPIAVGTQQGSLPFTGSAIDALAGLGAALVLTGAAAVASTRRRSARES